MMKKRVLFSLAGLIWLASCNQQNATSGAAAAVSQDSPVAAAPAAINSQQARALLAAQPAMLVLDVRTGQEFAGGHLEKALNLDFNGPDFQGQLAGLDKSKPYLVYCAVGGRSGKAAKLMQEMGFQQVYNVSEGFPELKSAGIPTAE